MADKTENIKTRLSFDGEAQYKAACKDINNNLKNLNAEMRRATAEYKGNENSIGALWAKQDVLSKKYDEQAKKVDEARKALERCAQQTGENSEATQKLQRDLNYAEAALYDTEDALRAVESELTKGEQAQKQYEDACTGIDENLDVLNAELQEINAKYSENGNAAKATAEKQKVLNAAYEEQAKKVAETEKAYESIKEEYGENSSEAKKLEAQIHKEKAALYDLDNQLNESKEKHSKLGEAVGKLGSVMAKMVAAIVAGAAAAGAALVGLTKNAMAGYADYEQLVGGVETLFNDSAEKVVGYANNAYKTAGMSANEYMETVTGFSASLLQSLNNDTEAAAEKADMAITDMSDNANKMGSDLTSLQNAYGGFAKGQFNMLDNLKLGYGGTKEEMQRLLDDATKLSGVKYDLDSYADIVDAIHVVQTEMGITGTTAKEAASTISGSISSAKSAWENWITGMADSEVDFGTLTKNLVDSVLTVVDNVVPRVIETVPRLVDGLGQVVSQLAGYIPGLITQLLPPLIDGVKNLLDTLVGMLPEFLGIFGSLAPEIVNIILAILPQVIDTAVQIIISLAQSIAQALPDLIPALVETVVFIVEKLVENIPLIIKAGLQLITGLVQGIVNAIPVLIEALPEIITAIINGLIEGLPLIIASAEDIMIAVIDGLITAVPLLIEAMPEIITAIVNGLITGIPQVLAAVGEMVLSVLGKLGELVQEIPPIIAEAVVRLAEWGVNMQAKAREVIATMITNVINLLKELPQKIWNAIVTCISKIAEWGTKMQAKAREAIANVCTSIVNGFKDLPGKMAQIGTNVVQGIWNGINDATSWIIDKIKGFGDAVLSGLKSFFGINSPSTLMRDEVGVYLAQGIGVGFEKEMQNVRRTMQGSIPKEFDLGEPTGTGNSGSPADRNGSPAAGGVVVNQYIYANETSYAGQQKAAAKNFRLIARTV